MSKALRITLGALSVLAIVAALVLAGFWFAGGWNNWDFRGVDVRRAGPGMMQPDTRQVRPWDNRRGPLVSPRGFHMGPGMMGPGTGPEGWGECPYADCPGSSWKGGSGSSSSGTPLTFDQAQAAVEKYLAGLGNDDLKLAEIMIFDNQAYARVVEKSTGIGAMELLVDPGNQAVYPEYGPNMMWNLKYGMMSGGGMMSGFRAPGRGQQGVSAEMPVSPKQAIAAAQQYLDMNNPGTKVEEAERFYGYYTLDILRDGQPVGMLSVNGYSSQVFPHTWHGKFIEMRNFE